MFFWKYFSPQQKKKEEKLSNKQQPTTNKQQPTTNNQQPTINNQQSTTNNQQPTTNSSTTQGFSSEIQIANQMSEKKDDSPHEQESSRMLRAKKFFASATVGCCLLSC